MEIILLSLRFVLKRTIAFMRFIVSLLLVNIVLFSGVALATNYYVTNLNDSGTGSFREALTMANDNDKIIFNPAISSGTILLNSPLPDTDKQNLNIQKGRNVSLFLLNSSGGSGANIWDVDQTKNIYGALPEINITVNEISNQESFEKLTIDRFSDLDSINATSVVASKKYSNRTHGLYANDILDIGEFSGSIKIRGENVYSYGMRTKGIMTIDEFSGSVDILCSGPKNYTMAIGLSSSAGGGKVSSIDKFSGSIKVESKKEYAIALQATDGELYIDEFSGTIESIAEFKHATGIYAKDITINEFSGSIQTSTKGRSTYGMYAQESLNGSDGKLMNISGSVIVSANGRAETDDEKERAAGIAAGQGLNINVTGTIQAIDTSGANNAFAILGDMYGGGGTYDDTVVLGNGASVTGQIDLAGGIDLLTLEGSGTLDGNVNGITTMTKTGAGTWTTTGEINANTLNINQGTLLISDNNTHTFDDINLQSDGILTVDIRSREDPIIKTNNTMTNNGQIHFLLNTLIPSYSKFNLISSGTISGEGIYTTSSPFFFITIIDNKIVGTKKGYADLFIGGGDPNVQAIASLFDTHTSNPDSDIATILLANIETSVSLDEVIDKLRQLFPVTISKILVGNSRLFSSEAQKRMEKMRAFYTMMPSQSITSDVAEFGSRPMVNANSSLSELMTWQNLNTDRNYIYLYMLGNKNKIDSHSNSGGYFYNGYDSDTTVLFGGFDRRLSKKILAGVSFGYTVTDVDYNDTGQSSADLKSYNSALYGSWFDNGWYLDTIISAAYHQHKTKRDIVFLDRTANSDSHGYTMSIKAIGGYDFKLKNFNLTPMLSLEYTSVRQNGYTETGTDLINISMKSMTTNSFQTGLGGKITMPWETKTYHIIPELSVMWMHEPFDRTQTLDLTMPGISDTAYTYVTDKPEPNSLHLGLGVSILRNSGTDIFVKYQGEFKKHNENHILSIGAQVQF